MKLRKAGENDFESIKELMEDKKNQYQCMYGEENVETKERGLTIKDIRKYIGKSEIKKQDYSFERFQQEISTNMLYIIEEDSEIIGCVGLYTYYKKHRIYIWAMYNPKDYVAKVKVLELLKKLPRVRKLSIVTIYPGFIRFLEENGFQKTSKCFFTLEINPKKTS